MTDSVPPGPRASVAEFMAFEGEPDARYELIGGAIVRMPLPTPEHGTIVASVAVAINERLRDRRPCRVAVSAGIRPDGGHHFLADIVLTCDPPRPDAEFVAAPLLVVEVLSDGSRERDLGTKLPRYVELPSVREVWLVESAERRVQVWRRAGEGWVVTLPLRGPATFASDVLADRVSLHELYANAGL